MARRPRSTILRLLMLVIGPTLAGCSIAPKSFIAVNDPAPLVRARAMGMNQGMPDEVVIPTLIQKLNDPDGVVRLTAIEELKRRTGQDLGYVPWGEPEDRARSMLAWQQWWGTQSDSLYAARAGRTRALSRTDYAQTRSRGRQGLRR